VPELQTLRILQWGSCSESSIRASPRGNIPSDRKFHRLEG